jgi:hypothetical protein
MTARDRPRSDGIWTIALLLFYSSYAIFILVEGFAFGQQRIVEKTEASSCPFWSSGHPHPEIRFFRMNGWQD